ncbi:DUF222 domain-containing protein [Trebonia sp.]|uniref:DUF222 domain-containing protein n=1 Tax=Trebonia sp. TaxID=2767075 RepID=UPI002623F28F|nr:DUF222 domain-containing protein [Trebonia sp.]
MSQPPVSGRGAGAQPGRGSRPPGGGRGGRRGRDPRLADFAEGGAGDICPPGPELAVETARLSGPDWRCDGATDDELIGLLGRWAATESWAVAAKLGVIREILRRLAVTPGMAAPDGLPEVWGDEVEHEVAGALGISPQAAGKLVMLAWTLEARLPGIGAKLADGTISYTKARLIFDELIVLDDEHAAQAEALILDELAGKTPGQIQKLAAGAVVTVDPEGARKRREHAEREDARVRFWRENTGASALAAYGLPTDGALAANANINARAGQYKKAKVSPGARMDQLRVLAFLDILNGISAADRIARAQAEANGAQHEAAAADGTGRPGADGEPDDGGPVSGGLSDDCGGTDATDDGTDAGGSGPADGPDGDGGPGGGAGGAGGGPGGGGPGGSGPDAGGSAAPSLPANANLTFPLATLLGLAERRGEGHGLGPLDPALVRDLAAAAARSPHSKWCVTITDANGFAVGHGCARPRRKGAKSPPAGSRDGPWAFIMSDDPGPPGGYGTWTLTLPGGQEFTVKLGPVPLTECDHRHESHAYQPSDTLRHLVEIRDGQCTFPTCSRHAGACDFEHALPYDKGGRTCACNAGMRSRSCHKVKQSKGWSVTQPLPGWHVWTTPSGRTYTQGPAKYPA